MRQTNRWNMNIFRLSSSFGSCFLGFVLLVVFVFLWLIVLRLERKEGAWRQYVGVVEETFLLTRYCFSLINLGTYALRLCLVCVVDVRVRPRSSVGILEEALDLTVDLCTALFLHKNKTRLRLDQLGLSLLRGLHVCFVSFEGLTHAKQGKVADWKHQTPIQPKHEATSRSSCRRCLSSASSACSTCPHLQS